jgi:hypothetical protein
MSTQMDEAQPSELSHTETLAVLKECGHNLDRRPDVLTLWSGPKPAGIGTVRELVASSILKIRNKRGRLLRLRLNRAQLDLEKTSGQRNIVLNARQLGVTTYVAARFFVSCITREGTLSVQVAHDQRSAEEIFRIVHRLLENLPEAMRKGALATSRANVRQIVFPMLDAIANKNIVDANKFQDGLSKVVDGVVACLNASVWAGTKKA